MAGSDVFSTYVLSSDVAAVDPNGVCEAQTTGGAANLTINGALTDGGVATLVPVRNATVTSAGSSETGKTFTIVRKTLPACKGSVYRDFLNIVKELEMYSEEYHNKSELSFTLNGNLIEFISVDQPTKIRGRKRNYLWLNEANEFSYEDWTQLILRTTEQIYLDYNPSDPYSWIYEKVLTRDDCTFIKSTYLANPFLDEDTITEIERLKDIDPAL